RRSPRSRRPARRRPSRSTSRRRSATTWCGSRSSSASTRAIRRSRSSRASPRSPGRPSVLSCGRVAAAVKSFQTRDGRTLAYRRIGSGPTLVCHPGGPGFSSRYFADFAGLGDAFTLVLLNPRGTEGSDRPADPRGYAIEDYVADLDELREHLGLDRMLLL